MLKDEADAMDAVQN